MITFKPREAPTCRFSQRKNKCEFLNQIWNHNLTCALISQQVAHAGIKKSNQIKDIKRCPLPRAMR